MKGLRKKLLSIMSLWPPFLGAGIRVKKISKDFSYARVEMGLSFLNANYVNVQFGGSMYSMTDPFYMLLFVERLGKEYIVWDKAAKIEFIKPGRKRVYAEFRVTDEMCEEVKKELETKEKLFKDYEVCIYDTDQVLIAKVSKTLYFRLK